MRILDYSQYVLKACILFSSKLNPRLVLLGFSLWVNTGNNDLRRPILALVVLEQENYWRGMSYTTYFITSCNECVPVAGFHFEPPIQHSQDSLCGRYTHTCSLILRFGVKSGEGRNCWVLLSGYSSAFLVRRGFSISYCWRTSRHNIVSVKI